MKGVGAPPRNLPPDLRLFLTRLKEAIGADTTQTGTDLTALQNSIAGQITQLRQRIAALEDGGGASTGGGTAGAVVYRGTWDASTGLRPVSNPAKGDFYLVTVAGSTDLDGINEWRPGDWTVYTGSVWIRVDNTGPVRTVNGMAGDVVITIPTPVRYEPLTNGDPINPEIVFVGGDVVMVPIEE